MAHPKLKVRCSNCNGAGHTSPRPYLARWIDEDRGPRSVAVLASDETAARDLIEQVTDHVDLIVTPA